MSSSSIVQPHTEQLKYDFAKSSYRLCITDTKGSHADLTADYAAVPAEMRSAAAFFGKEVLRDVNESGFYARIPEIRSECGDRAVMRAIHVFEENKRVDALVQCLISDDMETYLKIVKESGRSSWELLQNVIPEGAVMKQEMALALALAEKYLDGRGAARVHGGGFAGTIQVYVPNDIREQFACNIEAVLGTGSCVFVNVA